MGEEGNMLCYTEKSPTAFQPKSCIKKWANNPDTVTRPFGIVQYPIPKSFQNPLVLSWPIRGPILGRN